VVLHIVLFHPRETLSDVDRTSFAAAYETALREIPSIRQARVGRRITHGRGYEQLMRDDLQYAAVLEFDDLAGLLAYLQHPSHDELGNRLYEVADTVLVYDYELE
jgi:hypothetical protein